MRQNKRMIKIMKEELLKIRTLKVWQFYGFYYIYEKDIMKYMMKKLRDAGMEVSVRPVQRNNILIGNNLFVK